MCNYSIKCLIMSDNKQYRENSSEEEWIGSFYGSSNNSMNELDIKKKQTNTIDKKNHKDRKIIHVRLIQYLINFFKSEYPTLNRHPLKDLLSYLVEVDVKNKDFNSSKNESKIISKFSSYDYIFMIQFIYVISVVYSCLCTSLFFSYFFISFPCFVKIPH